MIKDDLTFDDKVGPYPPRTLGKDYISETLRGLNRSWYMRWATGLFSQKKRTTHSWNGQRKEYIYNPVILFSELKETVGALTLPAEQPHGLPGGSN